MKKFTVMLILACVLFIQGCSLMDGLILNGDGDVKDDIKNITDAGSEVGAAVATAHPAGYIISGISTLVAALAGGYAEMRRKQAKQSQDTLTQTKVVLEAIVQAVEDTKDIPVSENETVKDIVKENVTDKLKDKDFYKIGRAIIDAIKNS